MRSDKVIIRRPKYELPEGTPRGFFTELFEKTLNLGFSVSFIVVGKRTGISKTWGTAHLAEMLSPTGFTPKHVLEKDQYTYYAQNYIRTTKTLDPFEWMLFDESGRTGSGGSRQEWQSNVNKALASTQQISRFRVPISCFIVPHRGYIASQIFGLAQVLVVFRERGLAKLYHIEVSEFDGKIYTPYLCSLKVGFPDKDLIDAIEQKKATMWDTDTNKWVEEMDRQEMVKFSAEDWANKITKENAISSMISKRRSDGREFIDVKKLMKYAKVSKSKAYDIKDYIDWNIDALNQNSKK